MVQGEWCSPMFHSLASHSSILLPTELVTQRKLSQIKMSMNNSQLEQLNNKLLFKLVECDYFNWFGMCVKCTSEAK